MKNLVLATLLIISALTNSEAREITLSKSIKPKLRKQIENDLKIIQNL